MTIPEDSTLDIEEQVERQAEQISYPVIIYCYGNRMHTGPFKLAMWRYVLWYGKKRNRYSIGSGYLCEKCIAEMGAYLLPERK